MRIGLNLNSESGTAKTGLTWVPRAAYDANPAMCAPAVRKNTRVQHYAKVANYVCLIDKRLQNCAGFWYIDS